MAKKKTPKQKLPKYFAWRDGRPRWVPGTSLRAQGHKGRDLKDQFGNWLSYGAAIEGARDINATIGAEIPAKENAHSLRPADKTVDALIDHLEALDKFKDDGGKGVRLAHNTVLNYRSHFKKLREWAGDTHVAAIGRPDIEKFYGALVTSSGVTMANRVLSTLRMALNEAVNLEWVQFNRALRIKRAGEDGRLVMWTAEESIAFVECADWLGYHAIGDAHIFGLMSAQRRGDVLALPEIDLDAPIFTVKQRKTGRLAYVPVTELIRARVSMIRERKAKRWPGVFYQHEIVSSLTGAPYCDDGSTFSDEYRKVRAIASGLPEAMKQAFGSEPLPPVLSGPRPFIAMPSIWQKRFQDLRDTAVTLLYESTKGDMAKVANITGHSLSTIHEVIERHYFVRSERLAIEAGADFSAHAKRLGYFE